MADLPSNTQSLEDMLRDFEWAVRRHNDVGDKYTCDEVHEQRAALLKRMQCHETEDGCRYPMSQGRRCEAYPDCVCGRAHETGAGPTDRQIDKFVETLMSLFCVGDMVKTPHTMESVAREMMRNWLASFRSETAAPADAGVWIHVREGMTLGEIGRLIDVEDERRRAQKAEVQPSALDELVRLSEEMGGYEEGK